MEILKDTFKEILSDKSVWIECDGAIKYYWENHGGTKVPNKHLTYIFPEKILSRVSLIENEKYDYQRKIGTGRNEITVIKCIFSFDNPEILQKYIQEYDSSVDRMFEIIREKVKIYDKYTEARVHQEFLRIYVINMNEDENFTLSKYELLLIKDSYVIVKQFFGKYSHILNPHDEYFTNMILENISQLLDSYTVLKPYKLDDVLECAELINSNI